MEYEIDKEDAEYISNAILSGKLTPDALVQRISRTLKKKDLSQYLTLKVAQSLATYKRKVK